MIISTEQARGKIKVFADGEYIDSFEGVFWYSQNILDGDDIDDKQLASIILDASYRRAYQSAITILSHRAHSQHELLNKLKLKKHSPEACDYAIKRVLELGLIDDADYAARLAENLLERKGYSLERIRSELVQKGLDYEIIENTLESLDNDPIMRIIELLNTKFSSYNKDEKGKKKAFAALLRLGYSVYEIRSAFREAESWNAEPEESV